MRSNPLFSSGIVVLLAACASTPPPPPPAPPVQAAVTPRTPPNHTPPKLRLPTIVKPTAYDVSIHLSPMEEKSHGQVAISVELVQKTDVVWLHAGDNLDVTTAALTPLGPGAGKTRVMKVIREGDFLGLELDEEVAPGAYKLAVAFDGTMPTREGRGAYRQEENGTFYVFTQFESTDARRAFPCFDEPSFKAPWTVSLEVPKDDLAFSNAPKASEKASADGWKTVSFAPTKPLPSYLVAFAVGPFEVVDAGTAGQKKIPVRIIVPKGRSAEAKYAAETTGQVVDRLEKYFGIPYPYEKLDHIAVPQKGGAMENPGLITYGTTTILGKPEDKSIRLQRGYLSIAAHELGHIWFGDYVTTAWWDDIWLNEAFATWISSKIVDQWHPEWDGAIDLVRSKHGVMGGDAYVSSRRIRQPIESKHDIANAFDGITYQKGGAVIGMFESFVGEEPFRKGVHDYLAKHAYANATSAQFLADVGESLGTRELSSPQAGAPGAAHATEFAPAFASFLDQSGVPLVTAELSCGGGKTTELTLTQQRYVPLGVTSASEQTWQIPVCVSSPGGKSCTVLKDGKGTIALTGGKDGAKMCPAWINANAGAAGYYRVEYKGDLLGKLMKQTGKAPLGINERLAILSDATSLVWSGKMQPSDVLGYIPGIVAEGDKHLVGMAASIVGNLQSTFVTDELRPNYFRYVDRQFGAKAKALGWTSKDKDDDLTKLLRPSLLALAARDPQDALAKDARKLTLAWLKDRKAIEHDLVGTTLVAGARGGDRTLWDSLHDEAKKTKDRSERGQILAAMSAFQDPAIVQENFKVAMSDELDPRETYALIGGAAQNPQNRQTTYDFVKQNYDSIIGRMPREWGASTPYIASGFCDEAHRADVAAFFQDKAAKFQGGPRTLAQVLEGITLCTAQRTAEGANVTIFLQKY